MDSLEKTFNDMFVKNAPFQIPEKGRKWIADYAWIFALIGLIVGGFWFLGVLSVLGIFSIVATAAGVGGYVLFSWLSLLILGAYLVVLGISVPKLKAKQLSGWKLTYYSMLFFFVYDILNFVAYLGAGALMGLLWNLLWLVAALYVLFQVRSQFKGADKPATKK